MADDVIEEIQVDGTRAMIQSTVNYQVFYAFLTRLISDPFDAMTATVDAAAIGIVYLWWPALTGLQALAATPL
jgi:hypothetical protein